MCRSKKFVKRFHIQSQLYFRIHLLVKESNPARYAMSPPSASPRASCLSVNIGENCVLIKLFDPNVDLDFPKIGQIVFYITEIDLKGQDKLWGKIEDLQIFHICTQIQISVRSQLLNVQIQQMKLQPPKSIQNICGCCLFVVGYAQKSKSMQSTTNNLEFLYFLLIVLYCRTQWLCSFKLISNQR